MENKEHKGLYGRNITTKMRLELNPKSIILFDYFEGLWRDGGIVKVSNAYLVEGFGWSLSTIRRCIKELVDKGYVRAEYNNNSWRQLHPRGVVMVEQGVFTDEQGGVH